MAAAEVTLPEAAVGGSGVEPERRRRWRRRAPLIPLLPVGVVLTLAGPAMSGAPDLVRWSMGLAGCAMFFLGFEAAGTRWAGPTFDAALWLAVFWMAVVVLAAVFADLLPLAESKDSVAALVEPSRKRPDLLSRHPLGTDKQGLDVLGGIIYGARVSLQVSLFAVGLGLVVGGVLGVVAGYFRGWLDAVISFVTDSMLAFPPLILLIAIVTAIDPSTLNIGAALALLGIPTMARLARANTLTFAQREFVLSAQAMGATHRRIVFRELVPNVVRPLFSYAFLIVAVLIVAEASLSFLGVGIRRPTPTWGNMISSGQTEFVEVPHLVFLPATAMFLTVFSINRIGERLRQAWDPRKSSI